MLEASYVEIPFPGRVNLKATFECGQTFRWKRAAFPGRADITWAYKGVVRNAGLILGQKHPGDSAIFAAYDGARLTQSQVKEIVLDFLSAGDDLDEIERSLTHLDETMSRAVEHGSGLRILKQEPWECLASYLLSINRHIPAITKSIDLLCRCLGKDAGLGERTFPEPRDILSAGVELLKEARCGFRDAYLMDAAEKVAEGFINLGELDRWSTEEACEELQKIRGVGPKVADCVLLFGYHRLEVFPVDVWIARAVSDFYLGGKPVAPGVARAFGRSRFGVLAGYAQEYLYYYIRSLRLKAPQ